jgi:hypothetical protein
MIVLYSGQVRPKQYHYHLFTFRRSLFGNNRPLDVEIVIHLIKKLQNCNYSLNTLCDTL